MSRLAGKPALQWLFSPQAERWTRLYAPHYPACLSLSFLGKSRVVHVIQPPGPGADIIFQEQELNLDAGSYVIKKTF